MTAEQVFQHAKGEPEIMLAGRERGLGLVLIARHAAEPTENRIDNRLIECDPQIAVIAENSRHLFYEAFEDGDYRGILPAAATGQPKGRGEVMECDHWFQVMIPHTLEDGTVTPDGLIVPDTFAGLDAAPFHGHAVGILSHHPGCFQIRLGVVPPVAGVAGGLTAIDVAIVFPRMPVVVRVAAFHLMRGGRAAPTESGWEVEDVFGQGSLWVAMYQLGMVHEKDALCGA